VRTRSPIRRQSKETGIALLISIFVLLLISVVAIALIVSSGTETALAGNYRTATGVYYAALAGLEEARGRLLAKNTGSFKNTASSLIPTPLPIGQPVYIINPVGGETVAPWDPASTYPDLEFNTEFPVATYPLPNPSRRTTSLSTVAGVQGPSYKWVRINAVSESSLNIYVDGDTARDNQVLYYDSAQSKLTKISSGTQQAFEITSFAVLPNGSQKMLQYLAASAPITLPPFLAALTLSGSAGNGAAFSSPSKNTVFYVSGNEQDCSGSPVVGSAVAAIGVLNGSDINPVIYGGSGFTGILPASTRTNYKGSGPTAPDVQDISGTFPTNLKSPSQLDAIVNAIAPNADATFPPGSKPSSATYPLPTVYGSALTSLGMSPTNPLTVVVNGNLDISNWSNDGYGLLLVTGTFTYDPDTNWYGIILVMGQGIVNGSHMQYKQINGAMFVAQTRYSNGNLRSQMGGASVKFDDEMQGNGIRYSSCWIQKAQPTSGYKILSFHEISQQ